VKRVASVLAALLALTFAPAAWADEAEELIARGLELREKGKDDAALPLFKKAYGISPTPRARAQVALAEQALGMWVAAEGDLVAALGSEGDPWIAKNRVPLENALATIRRHVGGLEVRGRAGAEVFIDGARLGTLPASAPFRVEVGARKLEVRAKGFHAQARNVEITSGEVARETVTLVAMTDDDGHTSTVAGKTEGTSAVPPGGDEPGKGQRILGWAFVGTGGALVVVGAITMLVRKGVVDDYNQQCPGLGVAQPADCDDKVSSARTWLTVSVISFIGGGVLAAGGLALVFTAPSGESKKAASSPRLSCGLGAGLACAGTF
jgi:hypothetical protein